MPITSFARWGAFWPPRLPYPPSWPRSTTGWSNPAASPIPGATVTATEGDKKVSTTTDEQGAYAFSDLPDGVWTIEVEMFGFAKLSREVGVAPLAPSPTWELNILPPGAAMAANACPSPAAPATPAAAPARPAPASTATASVPVPAATPAATPATTTPAAAAAGRGGRGYSGGGRGGTQAAGNGGRPSLRQAQQQQGQPGYQRLDVNASGDPAAAGTENGVTGDTADLNQSASDALLVNGSVSRGLDMPQTNDWLAGRGGMMGMGMGMGDPWVARAWAEPEWSDRTARQSRLALRGPVDPAERAALAGAAWEDPAAVLPAAAAALAGAEWAVSAGAEVRAAAAALSTAPV